jgi:hypothetical protein
LDLQSESCSTQQPGVERREVVMGEMNAWKRQALQWVSALIGFLFVALEGLIGLRVLLRLMDANSKNGFAGSVYNFTTPFLAPIAGLTGNLTIGGNVLEITSLAAIIVYALIAWVTIRLVWLLFYQPSARIVTTRHYGRFTEVS